MEDDQIKRLKGHLHSLGEFRRRALAEGNEQRAARAEQAIIQLEGQITTLLNDLEREGDVPQTSGESTGPAEQTSAERQHILVINGDPNFLNMIRSLLQDERYNATTTNFVAESFDMIEALHPALLIVDLVIGERVGWDLLERLHRAASTQGIPVIAVSADEGELARVRWDEQRFGARRVLRKPLDLHALLDAIDGLIGAA